MTRNQIIIVALVVFVLVCICVVAGGTGAMLLLKPDEATPAPAPAPGPGPTPTMGELPQPVINYPVDGIVGQPVTFDGSESKAGSSPIASYEWDFGDGSTGKGPQASHVYNAPGKYLITLTVTDQNGFGNVGGPVEININPADAPGPTPPQPVINYPTTAGVGDPVTFDGSQSVPGSSPIAGYQWDFGDGDSAQGSSATHAYRDPGRYDITLTVADQDGLSNSTVVQIEITEAPPEPEPEPTVTEQPDEN